MRRKALSAIFVIMTEEDGEDFQAGGGSARRKCPGACPGEECPTLQIIISLANVTAGPTKTQEWKRETAEK